MGICIDVAQVRGLIDIFRNLQGEMLSVAVFVAALHFNMWLLTVLYRELQQRTEMLWLCFTQKNWTLPEISYR